MTSYVAMRFKPIIQDLLHFIDICMHRHKTSWQVLESRGPGQQPRLTEEMKMAGAALLSSQWLGCTEEPQC